MRMALSAATSLDSRRRSDPLEVRQLARQQMRDRVQLVAFQLRHLALDGAHVLGESVHGVS